MTDWKTLRDEDGLPDLQWFHVEQALDGTIDAIRSGDTATAISNVELAMEWIRERWSEADYQRLLKIAEANAPKTEAERVAQQQWVDRFLVDYRAKEARARMRIVAGGRAAR